MLSSFNVSNTTSYMCVSNFLTQIGDSVATTVENGDYDNEGHGVFAPMANMGMHTGQIANIVRDCFKHYSTTEAGRFSW